MLLTKPIRIGFLASHGGSSMRAILAAIRSGALSAEGVLAISNNADSPALDAARTAGVATRHISASSAGGVEAADLAIAEAMQAAGADLIVLSGYLRKLGPLTLERYRGRVLNIHPGLLPRYGGQGMYGRRVHEAVRAAGDAVTGATVHVVDAHYDTGPILAQREVPIHSEDTAEDIERRVMAAEPGLFVETLVRLAEGGLALPAP